MGKLTARANPVGVVVVVIALVVVAHFASRPPGGGVAYVFGMPVV